MTQDRNNGGTASALGFGAALALVLGSAPIVAPGSAMAQTTDSRAAGAGFECMARQLDSRAGARPFAVLVPRSMVETVGKAGYAPVPCANVFVSVEEQRKFRDAICDFVASQSESQQDQFESANGIRPNVLCAMAEAVVGQWDSRENRRAR